MSDALALSARDLARLLSISLRTVWQWDADGRLGPVATTLSPRCTRWDRAEIEMWWAACRQEGRLITRGEWQSIRNRRAQNEPPNHRR